MMIPLPPQASPWPRFNRELSLCVDRLLLAPGWAHGHLLRLFSKRLAFRLRIPAADAAAMLLLFFPEERGAGGVA